MKKNNQQKIEHDILVEVMHLMEKTGFDSFTAVTIGPSDDERSLEAALINLKNLAARYDKQDALIQVRSLMEKYNIQADELVSSAV
jgi:uncharacterized protein (DUF934 family)